MPERSRLEVVRVRSETDVDDRPATSPPHVRPGTARPFAVLRQPHDERASLEVEGSLTRIPSRPRAHARPRGEGRSGCSRCTGTRSSTGGRSASSCGTPCRRRPVASRELPRCSRSTETPQARRPRSTSAGRAKARRRPRGAGRRGSPPSPRPFAAGGRNRRGSRRPAPTGAARPDGERGSARICPEAPIAAESPSRRFPRSERARAQRGPKARDGVARPEYARVSAAR